MTRDKSREETLLDKIDVLRAEVERLASAHADKAELVIKLQDEIERLIRALARETYIKTCIGRPHMPHPDSDEGQRKIDRLYDICWAAVKP